MCDTPSTMVQINLGLLLVITSCVVYSNQNYTYYKSSGSLETLGKSEKFGVYLGYANNPFGPSVPSNSLAKMFQLENSVDFDVNLKWRKGQVQRLKRGVFDLYNVVSCATGCNPLIYKGYGCYCGFLGSGYAVDGIDRCCRLHDWCYNSTGCPSFLEYFIPYLWTCYHNQPLCARKRDQIGGPGSCSERLCECDRVLANCLSSYPCPASRAICKSSPVRLLQNALMLF